MDEEPGRQDPVTVLRQMMHPWRGYESIHCQRPTLLPAIIQFPGSKRLADAANLHQMLYGIVRSPGPCEEPEQKSIVEQVSNHILYTRWPCCAHCAEEVVVGILVAKRSWFDGERDMLVEDSIYSAWPFCCQCLAEAISDSEKGEGVRTVHILPVTKDGPKSLVYLGNPSIAALEVAEQHFDLSCYDSDQEEEEKQQQMQAASLLLTRGQKRSRKDLESGQ